jgi:hypothetical protein
MVLFAVVNYHNHPIVPKKIKIFSGLLAQYFAALLAYDGRFDPLAIRLQLLSLQRVGCINQYGGS